MFELAKDSSTRRALAPRAPLDASGREAVRAAHVFIGGAVSQGTSLPAPTGESPQRESEPDNGWTSLQKACALGRHEKLRECVDVLGPPPVLSRSKSRGGDRTFRQVSLGTPRGRSPAHLAALGLNGQHKNDADHLKCLQVLAEQMLLQLEAEDDTGMTPLLGACSSGFLLVVKWLLEQKADCYKEDCFKRNALHWASLKGHQKVVQFLSYYDCDVSQLKEGRDWKGRRPEVLWTGSRDAFVTNWEAARFGGETCTRTAVDAVSPSGWTAAMYAADAGNLVFLKTLVCRRANLEVPQLKGSSVTRQVRPTLGRGPLHLAAQSGHAELCTFLVRHDACLEATSEDGRTPFLWACAGHHVPTLQALYVLGADTQAVTKGSNAFSLGNRAVVQSLIAHLPLKEAAALLNDAIISVTDLRHRQMLARALSALRAGGCVPSATDRDEQDEGFVQAESVFAAAEGDSQSAEDSIAHRNGTEEETENTADYEDDRFDDTSSKSRSSSSESASSKDASEVQSGSLDDDDDDECDESASTSLYTDSASYS